MGLASVSRKVGCELDADKGAGQVGDFERTPDRVAVRDRHEVHAFRLCDAIDVFRLGVAFRAADLAHGPDRRLVREPGVNMQISS